ncbi:glycosyltransferase family 2 protein [Beduinella massiliensis]|uniref:glycosyltransferase family 2 protein n=1 Tax=Beduinella massiliensis TaxID=1852363 RepID=UPI0031F7DFEA
MEAPFISLVLPVRNEEKYIRACAESLFLQDYPKERMEVLFVDGCSTDRTVEILESMRAEHPLLRVLQNPNRTVPYAMNVGILESRGEYIVRMDAHAEYARDYVSGCIRALQSVACDNAGGVCVTRGRGYMGEAIAGALSTPFGVGNSMFRLDVRSGYVDTVPFGAFRRDLFDRIGLYDERLTRNQDNELNYRIRKNGGKIYLDQNIRCTYYCRDTLRGIMKMGFQNGMWNVVTLFLCPGSMGVRHFVPLCFVLSTLVLLALSLLLGPQVFGVLLALEWFAYLSLDAFYSYTVAQRLGMKYLPVLPVIFPAFHIAYGLGSLRGVFALPRFLGGKRGKK